MATKRNTILHHKPTGEVYYTEKNKKKLSDTKIRLKKYSAKLKKHVIFEEIKSHPKKKSSAKSDDKGKKGKEKKES